jgi:glycine betaine/proline transport system substrate-binding protein
MRRGDSHHRDATVSGLRRLFLLALWLAPLTAGAAGTPLRLVYANWSSSVASAWLVCAVVQEHLGRECRAQAVPVEQMWARVADGTADAMLSAWLPDTHRHYAERYAARLEDLGPNFEGTRTGLLVPDVSVGRQTGPTGMRTRARIPVNSIAELPAYREAFGGRIVGIEPDTGIMRTTRAALETYGLDGYRLVAGSEADMTAALSRAVRNQEWIVVTGWTPHWMFGRWSLRFLDDPAGVYGSGGAIHTLVRDGLAGDMPEIHRFLDRFHWDQPLLGRLMVWIETDERQDPYAQALRWLRAHPAQVRAWLE